MTYDIRHNFRTKYQIEAHDDIDDDEENYKTTRWWMHRQRARD